MRSVKDLGLGAPTELNYGAMIFSTFIRYVERIPTIKDLIKRLNDDISFKLNCEFLYSDVVPSEASYSRLLTKLSESNILEKVQEKIIHQAISEGFINVDTIAIDATHFESQLGISLTTLRAEVPQDPKWGVKKNSEGKNEFWFGYKGHLAVLQVSISYNHFSHQEI